MQGIGGQMATSVNLHSTVHESLILVGPLMAAADDRFADVHGHAGNPRSSALQPDPAQLPGPVGPQMALLQSEHPGADPGLYEVGFVGSNVRHDDGSLPRALQGRFGAPYQWRHYAINWLELEAIRLVLLHFSSQVHSKHVFFMSDNKMVIAYVNEIGGV